VFWTLVGIGIFAIVVITVVGIATLMVRQTKDFD